MWITVKRGIVIGINNRVMSVDKNEKQQNYWGEKEKGKVSVTYLQ
ncbi:MAG: hypothetical protein H6Q27_654 [Ignavibacteriaceae bacterium]|nr:hypothetical protein [Ignavibacteriaceae bacterium]